MVRGAWLQGACGWACLGMWSIASKCRRLGLRWVRGRSFKVQAVEPAQTRGHSFSMQAVGPARVRGAWLQCEGGWACSGARGRSFKVQAIEPAQVRGA